MQVPIRKKLGKFSRVLEEVLLTQEAADRLARQLKEAEAQVFVVAAEKERAAALGDRSENAEYQDAKGKLSRLHNRIASIKERLTLARIIKHGANDGVIDVGATVTVVVVGEDGNVGAGAVERTYAIVGAYETNPAVGKISNTSPLGKALLGHVVGDVVSFAAPSGQVKYKIVGVK